MNYFRYVICNLDIPPSQGSRKIILLILVYNESRRSAYTAYGIHRRYTDPTIDPTQCASMSVDKCIRQITHVRTYEPVEKEESL